MTGCVRIAAIGAWHIHSKDFTNRIMQDPNAEVAAVWDDDVERGQAWADECGCEFIEDVDELLARPDIDAVTVTCESTRHYEMIMKAAKAGKHIYVEKPPFLHSDEAYQARQVIQEQGVKFMIGSPIVKPMHLKTKEMLEEGLLGDVVSLRYRTVHELAYLGTQRESFFHRDENGGGAMMDMGNHALHLLSWFAGAPLRTEAVYTSWSDKAKMNQVDDNDIAVIEFQNGILGTIETGWVTPWYQYGFDLTGTKGSVSCRAYEMYACLEDGVWKRVPDEELPDPQTYPLHYWIDCIKKDAPIEWDNIDVAVLMTEMSDQMEAAALCPMQIPEASDSGFMAGAGNRQWDFARDFAMSGQLGEVLNIRAHCCGNDRLPLLEQRAKAMISSVFGDPLGEKKLVSTSGTGKGKTSVSLLTYRQNCLGIAEACNGIPEYETAVDICGTHGWLRIRGPHISYTTTEPGDRNAIWVEADV